MIEGVTPTVPPITKGRWRRMMISRWWRVVVRSRMVMVRIGTWTSPIRCVPRWRDSSPTHGRIRQRPDQPRMRRRRWLRPWRCWWIHLMMVMVKMVSRRWRRSLCVQRFSFFGGPTAGIVITMIAAIFFFPFFKPSPGLICRYNLRQR